MIGIGEDFGLSLPASRRNIQNGIIEWGDTPTDLAYYLGVLGTEYRLLSMNGENTKETIEELFYAIAAMNRLDLFAESAFGSIANLNGFFIRDDVSPNFLNMNYVIAHLNQHTSSSLITSLTSDYMSSNPMAKEESKDQVLELMWGLGIVSRCVPNTIRFEINGVPVAFVDGETSIAQEAKNIINRIVNYMRNNDPGWSWIIMNPVTQSHVERGYDAYSLSCGFAGAKFKLTGDPTPTTDPLVGEAACLLFKSLQATPYLSCQEEIKIAVLGALGNLWPDGVVPDNSNSDYNGFNILNRSVGRCKFEYLPLLHKVIHGGDPFLYEQGFIGMIENLLNSAPCFGPYNYGNGNYANYDWSSTTRFLHNERLGEASPDFPGDYNGLDYMILHNLYRLVYFDQLSPYLNLNNSLVANVFPYRVPSGPPAGYGSHTCPITITSFGQIVASNHILSDGNVSYKASQRILLRSGFKVDSGAKFHAFIDSVTCGSGGFERKVNQNIQSILHNESSFLNEKRTLRNINILKGDQMGPICGNTLDNFPNPFKDVTQIKYSLKNDGEVIIAIQNSIGEQIALLSQGYRKAGMYTFYFNASNLLPGIYYYTIRAQNYSATRKMVLFR